MVTGASKGSIAASVVGQLLDGGATVIATTSRLDDDRLDFYKVALPRSRPLRRGAVDGPGQHGLLRRHRRVGVLGRQRAVGKPGPQSIHIRDAQTPTLLFPFATAPRWPVTCRRPARAPKMEMKVLLWAVERLIGGLSSIGAERDIASRLHVVLPVRRTAACSAATRLASPSPRSTRWSTAWNAEASWAQRVSFAHALIGWTKGTGLMGHNDAIVGAVEEAGVTTYDRGDGRDAARPVHGRGQGRRRARPLKVDLTGGLGDIELDLAELAAKGPRGDDRRIGRLRRRAPARHHRRAAVPAARPPARSRADWADLDVDPADLVVIVGGAELGWYGSSRTRFEMEVDNELSAAGVLELAWTTGLIKWEDDPKPGWYDTAGGELVDRRTSSSGITTWSWSGAASGSSSTTGPSGGSRLAAAGQRLPRQGLQHFVVSSEAEARAFVEVDPEHTVAAGARLGGLGGDPQGGHRDSRPPRRPSCRGRWVRRSRPASTRRSGASPRHGRLHRPGGAVEHRRHRRRVPVLRIHPEELMRWVHPSLVASTQGTGMGGMTSMQTMYHGNLLGWPSRTTSCRRSCPTSLPHTSSSPTSAATAR